MIKKLMQKTFYMILKSIPWVLLEQIELPVEWNPQQLELWYVQADLSLFYNHEILK